MGVIKHIGVIRRSGRYPWGSGKNPYQRGDSFLSSVEKMEAQGLSQLEIAKAMGMSTKELRETKSIEKDARKAEERAFALRLKDKGYSNVAIGERIGRGESYVRDLISDATGEKLKIKRATTGALKDALAEGDIYLDVGVGVEQYMGVSRVKLNNAVRELQLQGYNVYYIPVRQGLTDKYTKVKVLAPPGVSYEEVSANRGKIDLINHQSFDGGRTFEPIVSPKSISSDRIYIRYAEDGGSSRDGVIQLRPGVEDISLGGVNYAQVRVAVDGKRYMKGMAMYGEDIPKGYDIVYNTKKPRGTDPNDVYKSFESDPKHPFGSTVRQRYYIDADGKKQLSPLNRVGYKEGSGEEGSWSTWSRNISSQILSKQRPALAKRQLDLDFAIRKDEFDEIMSVTNPTIRKKLLKEFSDSCDRAAVDLKAAPLPGQRNQVLLPLLSLNPKEIYAPNFNNGDQLSVLRHPHGGIFEIADLVVNNKNREGIRLLGDALDGVGIHPSVAQKLSGADFDGDTIIAIPNRKGYIISKPALNGLKNFDPHITYKGYKGMKVMSEPLKQLKMGDVSNLITDMTIKGASYDEIAAAVRHSMVIIDAPKHKLDWQTSYRDNNIAALKRKYQGAGNAGAATLISKAGSKIKIPQRVEGQYKVINGKKKKVYIDPATGKYLYSDTGKTYVDKNGKTVKVTTKIKRGYTVDDYTKLSSGTVMEGVYANYANSLKTLANTARKNMVHTNEPPSSKSAAKTYKAQVDSLNAKLRQAIRNKPLERKAHIVAKIEVDKRRKANPDMDKDDIKKATWQATDRARSRLGAKKDPVTITDIEWEAIQAGAISPTKLSSILENTNSKKLKERALPRTQYLMTPSKTIRAQSMLASGYTRSEVAKALGVSVSTLDRGLE